MYVTIPSYRIGVNGLRTMGFALAGSAAAAPSHPEKKPRLRLKPGWSGPAAERHDTAPRDDHMIENPDAEQLADFDETLGEGSKRT